MTKPRDNALATRLVLAHITEDYDAWHRTADEIGDCPDCWRRIANALGSHVAATLIAAHGENTATNVTQKLIAHYLDAANEQGTT